MAGATFNRAAAPLSRTLSLRAFNRYETEINEHFWSFKVVAEHAANLARKAARADASTRTAVVFHASGPDAERIPPTVKGWLAASSELENWLRMGALVSAAAYFESYLRQVIRCALASDPLCRYGKSGLLDGAMLLKRGVELPYEAELAEITKGDWSSRLAALKRLFGDMPGSLHSNVGALEKVRKLRNDYAHGFGRSLEVPKVYDAHPARAQRLSQVTFVSYVAVMSDVAAQLDSKLLRDHIGAFETIAFYHDWHRQARKPEDESYSEPRAFQRCLQRDMSYSVSTEFCEDLIAFYKSL